MKQQSALPRCLLAGLLWLSVLAVQSPGAGVTVVTHGWSGDADPLTLTWLESMGLAIKDRFGSADYSLYTVYVHDNYAGLGLTCELSGLQGGVPPADSSSGEIILLVDWRDVANLDWLGQPTWRIADKLDELLYKTAIPGLGKPLAELPIHLIGHSRGAALVTQLAECLGKRGIWVNQVTALDLHPIDDVPGYNNFDNPWGRPVQLRENVLFADGYRQNNRTYAADLDGHRLKGTYDRLIDYKLLQNGGWDTCHSDVHLWYHGTIDLNSWTGDGVVGITPDLRQNWYRGSEERGADTGYHFSRIEGGTYKGGTRPSGLGGNSGLQVKGAYRKPWSLSAKGADVWDNVELYKPKGNTSVTRGRTISVGGILLDQGGTVKDATLKLGVDTDRNPYNGQIQLWSRKTRKIKGNKFSESLDTDDLRAGDYYVYAKIQNDKHRRFFYAKGRVKIKGPVLSVTPAVRNVGPAAGTTTFRVANTGIQRMVYSASEAGTWLRITKGAKGTNSGSVKISYNANPGATPRTATIRVRASGAAGSPARVEIVQAGNASAGSRYQIILGSYTWHEAKADAEARGGHLATITSEAEWSAIQQAVGANLNGHCLWLGGTDEAQEGVWRWITGETWGYTRWHPGEPNNAGDEDYLHVNFFPDMLGSWNDSAASRTDVAVGYLLEFDSSSAPNSRYQIALGSYTWHEAKAAAEARGGHLATITSEAEWNAIQQAVGANLNGQCLWLGGTDEAQEGTWRWVTGEAWNYTRWHTGEPNDGNGGMGQHYLQVNWPDHLPGSWDDYSSDCSAQVGYLLEFDSRSGPSARAAKSGGSDLRSPKDSKSSKADADVLARSAWPIATARNRTGEWMAAPELADGDPNTVWTGAAGEPSWAAAVDFGQVVSIRNPEVVYAGEPRANAGGMGTEDLLEWFDLRSITNWPVDCRALYFDFPDGGSGQPPAIREIRWK